MSEDDLPEFEPSEPDTFHDKVVKLLQDWLNEDPDEDGPVLIDVAVVVWEQITMDDEGRTFRRVNYATLTHNAGLSSTVGLMSMGQDVLHGDLFDDEHND